MLNLTRTKMTVPMPLMFLPAPTLSPDIYSSLVN